MNLERRDNKASASGAMSTSHLAAYIRKLIDIYSAIDIHRDKWLREREKDFYVATVTHVLRGITNPISEEAVQIYKELFHYKVTKGKIADYINRVCHRGWAKYDKKRKRVEVIPLFDGIDIEEDIYDFNFRLNYEVDRSDMERDR